MYIGGSIKPKNSNLSTFADIGIGVGTHPMRIFIGDNGLFGHLYFNNHIRFDMNFGIGFRF